MRDIKENSIEIFRRDNFEKSKCIDTQLINTILQLLKEIQDNLYKKANIFLEENTFVVDDFDNFKEKIKSGGFVLAHWDGTSKTEKEIKKITKATIRCIPFSSGQKGKCILSGKPSEKRVFFAKAY